MIEIIRAHVGVPDLDVTLLNRSVWRMSKQVAASFRSRRVFLVGDAAHRFPPTGGFGLNSGVQDGHNLAWKLVYVLRGWASDKLLDSYDCERRPVAQSNADFSFGNRTRFLRMDQAIRSGNDDHIRFPTARRSAATSHASTRRAIGPADVFRISGSTRRASNRRSTGSTRNSRWSPVRWPTTGWRRGVRYRPSSACRWR